MTRLLIALLVLVGLAVGLSWLADRPGDLVLTWQGWRIETSLLAGGIAILVLIAALLIVWAVLRAIWRTPGAIAGRFRTGRRSRGFNAVTQGMLAVGSGDARLALKQAHEAERILGDEPLALLLRAQAAQLSGDRGAAETAFRAMLAQSETRPLGLRGLFVEARRRGDASAARRIAAEAVVAQPTLPWAATALLEFQCIENHWDGALATLARNAGAKLVDKATASRHRAVLLTARAQDEAELDAAQARITVLEALKLAPGLVPAAVLASRLYAESGDIKRAARTIETAWRLGPHPDLARALEGVRAGDSALDRLARTRTLVVQAPDHPESAIALARAGLAARDFGTARASLAPVIEAGGSSERVYVLAAEIEEAERGPSARSREWLARAVRAPRDPIWTADGLVSRVWLPVSPVSGRIDAFEWKAPVEQLGGPLVELSDLHLDAPEEPALIAADVRSEPVSAVPAIEPAAPAISTRPATTSANPSRLARPAPVVASHPVPDDPGPDDEGDQPVRSRVPLLD